MIIICYSYNFEEQIHFLEVFFFHELSGMLYYGQDCYQRQPNVKLGSWLFHFFRFFLLKNFCSFSRKKLSLSDNFKINESFTQIHYFRDFRYINEIFEIFEIFEILEILEISETSKTKFVNNFCYRKSEITWAIMENVMEGLSWYSWKMKNAETCCVKLNFREQDLHLRVASRNYLDDLDQTSLWSTTRQL